MAPPVPPIKHKRRDEISDCAAQDRVKVAELKERPGRKPSLPGSAGYEHNTELDCVDGEDAGPPSETAGSRHPDQSRSTTKQTIKTISTVKSTVSPCDV